MLHYVQKLELYGISYLHRGFPLIIGNKSNQGSYSMKIYKTTRFSDVNNNNKSMQAYLHVYEQLKNHRQKMESIALRSHS